jgi:hypothetical protein
MPKNKDLAEKEKEKIERLWLRAPLEKPLDMKDSLWIESKTGIPRTQVARQLQELTVKKYGRNTPLTEGQKKLIEENLLLGVPQESAEAGLTPALWISHVTHIYERKVAGWISELNKTKNRVLIVDTTSPSREHKSESNFLHELLRMYNWNGAIASTPKSVKAKEKFLQTLRDAKERYIHVSAHGSAHDEEGKPTETRIQAGIWLELEPSDIYRKDKTGTTRLWPKNGHAPYIIVATACEAGRQDLANAFWKTGCRYYVAPLHKVPWINSAIFSTLFYYYLLVERWSPIAAFRKTIERLPDQTGKWILFEKGKKKPNRSVSTNLDKITGTVEIHYRSSRDSDSARAKVIAGGC